MEIAFFEVEDWQQKYLKSKLKGHKLRFFREHLNGNHLDKIKNIEVLCIFVYSHITEEIVKKLPKLKMICTMSTGYDHINIDFCRKEGLKVCNAATYAQNTVAEHTMALILALSNKVIQSVDRVRNGKYNVEGLTGIDLQNKTLGIIGVGRIGVNVIRMAKGFNMKVVVYDVFKNNKLAKKFDFKYVSLDSLLKNSDVVSLHCPSTDKNIHLLNKSKLMKMKKNAILINTARGKLIDTIALVDAVKKKNLKVGLDVLENEKEMKKGFNGNDKIMMAVKYLIKNENVLITPHNAFNSEESLYRLLDETVENIKGKRKCLIC